MDFGAELRKLLNRLNTHDSGKQQIQQTSKIYDACLAVHHYAAKMVKPGITWLENAAAAEMKMNKQPSKLVY
ncbi:MAG: hypothetical protein IPN26_17700 [Bacteroidetes bacterium]|nr:hypothetical protein [Bacteroidota bacterium]